jgi:hypothetical protein
MPEKRKRFAKGEKTEMVNYLFYAVCSETTSWEQKVVVAIPEHTTDEQREALGQVLVKNQEGIKELGFFDRFEEREEEDIEIHEGGVEEDSEESVRCRLNDDGEWEIEGIHWEVENTADSKDQSQRPEESKEEDYTAIRLVFERLVPVSGVVEVWVPSCLAKNVEVGSHLAATLEDALLERDCVSWNKEADLKRPIRSPQLDSVEVVNEQEEDVDPVYRGVLKPTGGWKIMRLVREGESS